MLIVAAIVAAVRSVDYCVVDSTANCGSATDETICRGMETASAGFTETEPASKRTVAVQRTGYACRWVASECVSACSDADHCFFIGRSQVGQCLPKGDTFLPSVVLPLEYQQSARQELSSGNPFPFGVFPPTDADILRTCFPEPAPEGEHTFSKGIMAPVLQAGDQAVLRAVLPEKMHRLKVTVESTAGSHPVALAMHHDFASHYELESDTPSLVSYTFSMDRTSFTLESDFETRRHLKPLDGLMMMGGPVDPTNPELALTLEYSHLTEDGTEKAETHTVVWGLTPAVPRTFKDHLEANPHVVYRTVDSKSHMFITQLGDAWYGVDKEGVKALAKIGAACLKTGDVPVRDNVDYFSIQNYNSAQDPPQLKCFQDLWSSDRALFESLELYTCRSSTEGGMHRTCTAADRVTDGTHVEFIKRFSAILARFVVDSPTGAGLPYSPSGRFSASEPAYVYLGLPDEEQGNGLVKHLQESYDSVYDWRATDYTDEDLKRPGAHIMPASRHRGFDVMIRGWQLMYVSEQPPLWVYQARGSDPDQLHTDSTQCQEAGRVPQEAYGKVPAADRQALQQSLLGMPAVHQRPSRLTTTAVMGGVSAKAAAQACATSTGTPVKQAYEWLHCVAHAMGGVSADSAINLVLGTDHANSHMMTYETVAKKWKAKFDATHLDLAGQPKSPYVRELPYSIVASTGVVASYAFDLHSATDNPSMYINVIAYNAARWHIAKLEKSSTALHMPALADPIATPQDVVASDAAKAGALGALLGVDDLEWTATLSSDDVRIDALRMDLQRWDATKGFVFANTPEAVGYTGTAKALLGAWTFYVDVITYVVFSGDTVVQHMTSLAPESGRLVSLPSASLTEPVDSLPSTGLMLLNQRLLAARDAQSVSPVVLTGTATFGTLYAPLPEASTASQAGVVLQAYDMHLVNVDASLLLTLDSPVVRDVDLFTSDGMQLTVAGLELRPLVISPPNNDDLKTVLPGFRGQGTFKFNIHEFQVGVEGRCVTEESVYVSVEVPQWHKPFGISYPVTVDVTVQFVLNSNMGVRSLESVGGVRLKMALTDAAVVVASGEYNREKGMLAAYGYLEQDSSVMLSDVLVWAAAQHNRPAAAYILPAGVPDLRITGLGVSVCSYVQTFVFADGFTCSYGVHVWGVAWHDGAAVPVKLSIDFSGAVSVLLDFPKFQVGSVQLLSATVRVNLPTGIPEAYVKGGLQLGGVLLPVRGYFLGTKVRLTGTVAEVTGATITDAAALLGANIPIHGIVPDFELKNADLSVCTFDDGSCSTNGFGFTMSAAGRINDVGSRLDVSGMLAFRVGREEVLLYLIGGTGKLSDADLAVSEVDVAFSVRETGGGFSGNIKAIVTTLPVVTMAGTYSSSGYSLFGTASGGVVMLGEVVGIIGLPHDNAPIMGLNVPSMSVVKDADGFSIGVSGKVWFGGDPSIITARVNAAEKTVRVGGKVSGVGIGGRCVMREPINIDFTVGSDHAVPVGGDMSCEVGVDKQDDGTYARQLRFAGGIEFIYGPPNDYLRGDLAMQGQWERAFGLPFLTLKDVQLGISLHIPDYTVDYMRVGARVCLGEPGCTGETMAYGEFGGSDADQDFVVVMLQRLNVGDMLQAFGIAPAGVPQALLGTDICPYDDSTCVLPPPQPQGVPGTSAAGLDKSCYVFLSYAKAVQGMAFGNNQHMPVPEGLHVSGRLNILNWELPVDLAVNFPHMTRIDFTVPCDPLHFSFLRLARRGDDTLGPLFDMHLDGTEGLHLNISSTISIPFLGTSRDLDVVADDKKFSFDGSMDLFGGALTVDNAHAEWAWDASTVGIGLRNFSFASGVVQADNVVLVQKTGEDGEEDKFQLEGDFKALWAHSLGAAGISVGRSGHGWWALDFDTSSVSETAVATTRLVGKAYLHKHQALGSTPFQVESRVELPQVGKEVVQFVESAAETVNKAWDSVDLQLQVGVEKLKEEGQKLTDKAFDSTVDFLETPTEQAFVEVFRTLADVGAKVRAGVFDYGDTMHGTLKTVESLEKKSRQTTLEALQQETDYGCQLFQRRDERCLHAVGQEVDCRSESTGEPRPKEECVKEKARIAEGVRQRHIHLRRTYQKLKDSKERNAGIVHDSEGKVPGIGLVEAMGNPDTVVTTFADFHSAYRWQAVRLRAGNQSPAAYIGQEGDGLQLVQDAGKALEFTVVAGLMSPSRLGVSFRRAGSDPAEYLVHRGGVCSLEAVAADDDYLRRATWVADNTTTGEFRIGNGAAFMRHAFGNLLAHALPVDESDFLWGAEPQPPTPDVARFLMEHKDTAVVLKSTSTQLQLRQQADSWSVVVGTGAPLALRVVSGLSREAVGVSFQLVSDATRHLVCTGTGCALQSFSDTETYRAEATWGVRTEAGGAFVLHLVGSPLQVMQHTEQGTRLVQRDEGGVANDASLLWSAEQTAATGGRQADVVQALPTDRDRAAFALASVPFKGHYGQHIVLKSTTPDYAFYMQRDGTGLKISSEATAETALQLKVVIARASAQHPDGVSLQLASDPSMYVVHDGDVCSLKKEADSDAVGATWMVQETSGTFTFSTPSGGLALRHFASVLRLDPLGDNNADFAWEATTVYRHSLVSGQHILLRSVTPGFAFYMQRDGTGLKISAEATAETALQLKVVTARASAQHPDGVSLQLASDPSMYVVHDGDVCSLKKEADSDAISATWMVQETSGTFTFSTPSGVLALRHGNFVLRLDPLGDNADFAWEATTVYRHSLVSGQHIVLKSTTPDYAFYMQRDGTGLKISSEATADTALKLMIVPARASAQHPDGVSLRLVSDPSMYVLHDDDDGACRLEAATESNAVSATWMVHETSGTFTFSTPSGGLALRHFASVLRLDPLRDNADFAWEATTVHRHSLVSGQHILLKSTTPGYAFYMQRDETTLKISFEATTDTAPQLKVVTARASAQHPDGVSLQLASDPSMYVVHDGDVCSLKKEADSDAVSATWMVQETSGTFTFSTPSGGLALRHGGFVLRLDPLSFNPDFFWDVSGVPPHPQMLRTVRVHAAAPVLKASPSSTHTPAVPLTHIRTLDYTDDAHHSDSLTALHRTTVAALAHHVLQRQEGVAPLQDIVDKAQQSFTRPALSASVSGSVFGCNDPVILPAPTITTHPSCGAEKQVVIESQQQVQPSKAAREMAGVTCHAVYWEVVWRGYDDPMCGGMTEPLKTHYWNDPGTVQFSDVPPSERTAKQSEINSSNLDLVFGTPTLPASCHYMPVRAYTFNLAMVTASDSATNERVLQRTWTLSHDVAPEGCEAVFQTHTQVVRITDDVTPSAELSTTR